MSPTFDEWFRKAYPAVAEKRDPEALRICAVAEAAWNDSRQLAIAAVVFRIAAARKTPAPPNTDAAVARKALGALLVEIAEME